MKRSRRCAPRQRNMIWRYNEEEKYDWMTSIEMRRKRSLTEIELEMRKGVETTQLPESTEGGTPQYSARGTGGPPHHTPFHISNSTPPVSDCLICSTRNLCDGGSRRGRMRAGSRECRFWLRIRRVPGMPILALQRSGKGVIDIMINFSNFGSFFLLIFLQKILKSFNWF